MASQQKKKEYQDYVEKILLPIPKTCPSVLYSIADATTELANPVIGTSAP